MMKLTLIISFFFIRIVSFSQNDSTLNLYFDFDKYNLLETHLWLIHSILQKEGRVITSVKGFTDTIGSARHNVLLSEKRANAVYGYLKNLNLIDSVNELFYAGEKHSGNSDLASDRKVEFRFHTLKKETIISEDTLVMTEKYEITNIYFVPDKAIIEAASIPVISDIANYLKRFNDCQFEIIGHVNYVLSEAAMKNIKVLEPIQQLSEARAKVVYDLLAERGIEKLNMTYKGAGNSQMYFKNPKDDEEKRKNMRVEILILFKK